MTASDLAVMHDRLRRDTTKMLGFAEPLSAQQALKVDLACSLRWQIDKFVSAQLAGGDIDLKQLTSATEALRSLFPTADASVISDREDAAATNELERLIGGVRAERQHRSVEVFQKLTVALDGDKPGDVVVYLLDLLKISRADDDDDDSVLDRVRAMANDLVERSQAAAAMPVSAAYKEANLATFQKSDPDAPPASTVKRDYIDHAVIEPSDKPPEPTDITPVNPLRHASLNNPNSQPRPRSPLTASPTFEAYRQSQDRQSGGTGPLKSGSDWSPVRGW